MQHKPINSSLLTTQAKPAKNGFTLLEISIVIGIIALIIGMGLNATQSLVKSARITATDEKMKVIEDALETFWLVNGRLPCPADATMTDADTNYGVEAAANDTGCTGTGSPDANTTFSYDNTVDGYNSLIAEGMIPFATLNIPESFTLDAWKGRFSYAVDAYATLPNAASRMHTNSQCPSIKMAYQQSAYNWTNYQSYWTNNPNNTGYAYVVLSHGENLFGAYSQTGTRILNNDANEEEGVNAWLETSFTAPDTTWQDRGGTGTTARHGYIDGFDQYGGFDDVLRYKTISQLNKDRINQTSLLEDIPVLFYSGSSSPYIYAYTWDGNIFTRYPSADITGAPSGALVDGGIMTSGNECTKRVLYADGTSGDGIGQHQFATHYSNDLTYASSGISGAANDIIRDPNSSRAAVLRSSSPYVSYIDEVTQDNITACSSDCTLDTTPGSTAANGGDYSIYGHLAVAHDDSPYISIYYDNSAGDHARNKIDDPVSLPTGTGNDADYSPDGKFLAVAHDASPYVTMYEAHGTTYSKFSDPDTLPTGNATSVDFSSDGRFLIVGHETAPFFTIYSVDADTGSFTKLNDPADLPSGTVNSASFANAGSIFAVAVASTTGNSPLLFYQIQHGQIVTQMTAPADLPATGGTGYAVRFTEPGIINPPQGIIANGLVGRWRFDDDDDATVATTTADSSSERNDGTLTNGPTYSTEAPAALAGSGHSIDLDGVNDYVNIIDPPGGELDFGTDQDFSISLWVKTTNNGGWILSKYPFGSSPGYGIEIISNSARPFLHDDSFGFYAVQGSTDINDNQWHHIVAVYDRDGEFILYVNNAEDAARGNISSANNTDNSGNLVLGGFGTSGSLLGQLDDVRIYNRVLTPSEIARIYYGDG